MPREQVSESSGLEEILSRTGDGAVVIDPDGRITFWNAAAEQIFGRPGREVLRRPCCEIFAGYDDNRNVLCSSTCQVMALVRQGEPVNSFDMRTRTKAGRPIWINVSVLSTAGPRGPLMVHIFRDVTAAKELVTLIHERLAPAAGEHDGAAALSRRELEVLRLLTEGLSNASVAERLRVHRGTVRNHVRNIFAKLGVHSRLQAVAYATRHRMF